MKLSLLLLIFAVLIGIAGCTSSDDTGAARTTFGGPPVMSGSDSNASENRY